MKWENVYIFISSTFNDMHAERDYLVKRVFPQLATWCEERRLRLIDIDLRWGVSETDATQNKRVIQVCLDRIDECRPFFLCFLGQRRGWVPEYKDVSDETKRRFPNLIKNSFLGNHSITEMEILHALIDPLHNGTFFNKKDNTTKDGSAVEHAFFFLRENDYLKDIRHPDLEYVYTNKGDADQATADKELERWRNEKIPTTGRPVFRYFANWNYDENTPEIALPYVVPTTAERDSAVWKDAFAKWKKRWAETEVTVDECGEIRNPKERKKAEEYNARFTGGRLGNFRHKNEDIDKIIIRQLQDAIKKRFGERHTEQLTPLQKELDQQEQFLRVASAGYIERNDDFDAINEYINNKKETRPFAVTALAGMGKTSFLAHWIDNYSSKVEASLHYRFVGCSDDSVNSERLCRSLLEELKATGKIAGDIPVNAVEMFNKLPDLLEEAGRSGKTILVIDALNQLETGLLDLYWIPARMPENIRMILSFKKGDSDSDKYYNERLKVGDMILQTIKPFDSEDDRRQFVSVYLDQYFKELDEPRIEALVSSEGANNPLFLKTVLSELRVFGVHNNLTEVINNRFGKSTVTAFHAILQRMEDDPAYTKLKPQKALPHIFGWIAHSRFGLSAEELTALLIRARLTDCKNEAEDVIALAIRQLRPFLANRDGRIDFFYESFKVAAIERYTGIHPFAKPVKQWHRLLSEYFESLPLGNRHKLMEQVWQYVQAGETEKAFELLTCSVFITKKAKTLFDSLLSDYDCLAAVSRENKDKLLRIKERLISLAFFLKKYPSLAEQTLYSALLTLRDMRNLERLEPMIKSKNGVVLRSLGSSVYSVGGTLTLPEGRFLSASPDGKHLLSMEGGFFTVRDSESFRILFRKMPLIKTDEICSAAISDELMIAQMDTSGKIKIISPDFENKTIESDRQLFAMGEENCLYIVCGGKLMAYDKNRHQILSEYPPACFTVRGNLIAYIQDGYVCVQRHEDNTWQPITEFPVAAPNIRAMAISANLSSIITLSMNRRIFKQDINTGEILYNAAYVSDLGLPLVKIPFGCGANSSDLLYLVDGEGNAACIDSSSGKSILYVAGTAAHHPKTLPVALAVSANQMLLLLPACAIRLNGDNEALSPAHIGGVSAMGFLNNGMVFTLMENDSKLLVYHEDGRVLYTDPIMAPVTATSFGDKVFISLANHNLVFHKPGIPDTTLYNNLPFSEKCVFLETKDAEIYAGTRKEIHFGEAGARGIFIDRGLIYKAIGSEEIRAMAAAGNAKAAVLIRCTEISNLRAGIVENGIFTELSQIHPSCTACCMSPDEKWLCAWGARLYIVSVQDGHTHTINRECRVASFREDGKIIAAFTDTDSLEIIETSNYNILPFAYVPDRVMAIKAEDDKILCGFVSGRATLITKL